jgi:hypothetical protein
MSTHTSVTFTDNTEALMAKLNESAEALARSMAENALQEALLLVPRDTNALAESLRATPAPYGGEGAESNLGHEPTGLHTWALVAGENLPDDRAIYMELGTGEQYVAPAGIPLGRKSNRDMKGVRPQPYLLPGAMKGSEEAIATHPPVPS